MIMCPWESWRQVGVWLLGEAWRLFLLQQLGTIIPLDFSTGHSKLLPREPAQYPTSGVSVEAPMTWQLRSANSSERSENAMISVGHTKVKSLG